MLLIMPWFLSGHGRSQARKIVRTGLHGTGMQANCKQINRLQSPISFCGNSFMVELRLGQEHHQCLVFGYCLGTSDKTMYTKIVSILPYLLKTFLKQGWGDRELRQVCLNPPQEALLCHLIS